LKSIQTALRVLSTTPSSIAFEERIFSQLKLIKKRALRSTVTHKRLRIYQWLLLSVTLHANLIILHSLMSL